MKLISLMPIVMSATPLGAAGFVTPIHHHRCLSRLSTPIIHPRNKPHVSSSPSLLQLHHPSSSDIPTTTRRDILSQILTSSSLILLPNAAHSDDEDDTSLASKLFNPDGSLKSGEPVQDASFTTISLPFSSTSSLVSVDGEPSKDATNDIILQYQLPAKWKENYIDTSEGINAQACSKITLYKPPGTYTLDTLEKAPRKGMTKSLQLPLTELKIADLTAASKKKLENQQYYGYDLALAPKTCGQSAQNLGLGFCPYDQIVLLSATVLNGSMYVFCLESSGEQWRRANSDLKRVRDSFRIRTDDDKNKLWGE